MAFFYMLMCMPLLSAGSGMNLENSKLSQQNTVRFSSSTKLRSTYKRQSDSPVEVCGSHLTASVGTIQSPNYPRNYPHNLDCQWTIEAPFGSVVELSFDSFRLQPASRYNGKCFRDKLVIQDANGDSRTLCGHDTLESIISGTNEVSLLLTTDGSDSYAGFRINYRFIRQLNPGCGGIILGPGRGNITSPNYPGNYPNDLECRWEFRGPRNGVFSLFWYDFQTERDDDGNCLDVMTLSFDGNESGAFCGEKSDLLTTSWVSRSDTVIVTLSTNSAGRRRGFKFDYVNRPSSL